MLSAIRSPLFGVIGGFFIVLYLGTVPKAVGQVELKFDIAYGPQERQHLDLCRASTSGVLNPAVILIHGGGWNGGEKEFYRPICRYFADHGVTAATIEYRFADGSEKGRWPAQLIDAQLAIRWVRAHAKDLNIDPHHICVDGYSAGAHMAIFLAAARSTIEGDYADQLAGFPSDVSCAVDNFGPADFTIPSPFQHALDRFFPGLDEAARMRHAKEVSPLFAVGPTTAPIFIAHGYADASVAISQSIALADALNQAKVRIEFMAFDGGHGWQGLTKETQTAILDLELDFIRRAPAH